MRHVSLLGAIGRGFMGLGRGLRVAGRKDDEIEAADREHSRQIAAQGFLLLQQMAAVAIKSYEKRHAEEQEQPSSPAEGKENKGGCGPCRKQKSSFIEELTKEGSFSFENLSKLTRIFDAEVEKIREEQQTGWPFKIRQISEIFAEQQRSYLSQNAGIWNACLLWDISIWGSNSSLEIHDAIKHILDAYDVEHHSHGRSAPELPVSFDFGVYVPEFKRQAIMDDLWETFGDELRSGRLKLSIKLHDRVSKEVLIKTPQQFFDEVFAAKLDAAAKENERRVSEAAPEGTAASPTEPPAPLV